MNIPDGPALSMQSVIDSVEQRAEKKKQEIFEGVDARNKALDELLSERLKSMAAISSAVTQVVAPTPAVPDASPKEASKAKERLYGTLGLKTRVSVPVSISKQEALNMIAKGETSIEMESIIDAGARVLALSAAFDAKVVTGPRKGLTAWQTAGLALAGTAAVGAGVTVGVMYVTDTGLFRPKPVNVFETEIE